jgi:hypothetical protein
MLVGPLRAVFCQLHGTTWIAKSGDHPARRVCVSAVRPLDRCVMSVDVERWIVASCRWTWRSSSVGFREVGVVDVREVLRGWLEGAGLRKVAERAGVDRKTARRYVRPRRPKACLVSGC